MRKLALALLFTSSVVSANSSLFSGELAAEYRYFYHHGLYGNEDRNHASLMIRPEYSLAWDNDRSVISIIPFARLDRHDNERSHYDIRELSLVSSWPYLELRIGISKVFWGVTESQHLVDVINQTDYIENPDGEQKLGQPMINPTVVTRAGNFEMFIMPYFRERTFPGEHGRYRGALLVDTDNAEFTNRQENSHTDYALRWTMNWQDLEWAVSYYKGTDREPVFRIDAVNNLLVPVYGQSRQTGVELQHTFKDLLTKVEYIHKHSDIFPVYNAATAGFEYTFVNIYNGMDVGLLYEWLYDSRDRVSPTGMYDSHFVGSRIAANDVASSQLLAGAIYNNDTDDMTLYRLEASRRLGQNFKLALEFNNIVSPPEVSMPAQVKADDYFQITVSAFF